MSNEIQKSTSGANSLFSSIQAFEDGQRIAKGLCTSNLVPEAYKGNVANTMVALEMANRINISPFMVMQNLHIIKGKPSWSSTFIISALNTCGRFEPIRFKFEGDNPESDEYGCRAITKDLKTGESIIGPIVTWKMVKAEGWLSKSGSKWQTMPELMFQYRAAAFFGRLYAPDILTGMQSVEEVVDVSVSANTENELDELQSLFMEKEDWMHPNDKQAIEQVIKNREHTSYKKAIQVLKEIQEPKEVDGDE